MAKYVPDVRTERWIVISPARKARPDDATAVQSGCPFCPGNEQLTPPEVYRIGGGDKDTQGWQVRVVPNKYPITDIHEVIIHSPDAEKDIEDLPIEQVQHIVTAYRDRYRAHEDDGQVLIFCNHGLQAGASLKHPHSQLVVVPKQISLDALPLEPLANIVEESNQYVIYCPEFSQWPYEVWITPKEKGTRFGDTKDESIGELSSLLQKTLRRIRHIFDAPTLPGMFKGMEFGYNFYIATGTDWFIRIIPRFVHRAGFELGTGLNVNIIDPEDAAADLKNHG